MRRDIQKDIKRDFAFTSNSHETQYTPSIWNCKPMQNPENDVELEQKSIRVNDIGLDYRGLV